jgi:hypothetical protein
MRVDAGVEGEAEMIHQSRRIHVSVTNGDAAGGHGFSNQSGRDAGKAEAEGRDALGDAGWVVHAVDNSPCGIELLEHGLGERGFVVAYGRHGANDGLAPRCGLDAFMLRNEAVAEGFEIGDSGCHTGNILDDEGAGLDFEGRGVADEVLAEGGERVEKFEASPEETHVRREDLVTGADQVVAAEGLHIDEGVRRVVNAVESNLGAGGVRQLADGGHVDDGTEGVRGNGAATRWVFEVRSGARSSRCRLWSSRIFHQTILAPSRSSCSQVAMLASWSRSVTTISLRVLSVRPMARPSRRRNEVEFMPKAISLGSRALMRTATVSSGAPLQFISRIDVSFLGRQFSGIRTPTILPELRRRENCSDDTARRAVLNQQTIS